MSEKGQAIRPSTTDRVTTLANQIARSSIAVIDAVAARGGFRGEELLSIGQLREQSVQLVQLYEQLQREQAEQVSDQPA